MSGSLDNGCHVDVYVSPSRVIRGLSGASDVYLSIGAGLESSKKVYIPRLVKTIMESFLIPQH